MDKIYFNTKQLSEYIGRTPKAVRDMTFRKMIPYRKAGGRLIFVKGEVDQWIEAGDGLSFEDWQQLDRQKAKTLLK